MYKAWKTQNGSDIFRAWECLPTNRSWKKCPKPAYQYEPKYKNDGWLIQTKAQEGFKCLLIYKNQRLKRRWLMEAFENYWKQPWGVVKEKVQEERYMVWWRVWK